MVESHTLESLSFNMARRGQDGSDKIHNRKKELKQKDFDRKKNNKNKVPDVILSCEDSVSAPTYFQRIIDNLIKEKKITQDSFIIVPHLDITHPSGVLKKLKEYKDENGKTYKDFDHKWIIIDRDIERVNGGGHKAEDFNLAINNAKSKKSNFNIEVAYANDSFELWYLLHFEYRNTAILRDEISTSLIKKLKTIDPHLFLKLNKKNIKDKNYTKHIFNTLLSLQNTAIKNAEKLLNSYSSSHNPEKDNPSTTVHKLVKILNNL